MNICPQCNTSNPHSVKFCLQCARSLSAAKNRSCPACNHSVPNESRFCGQCGTSVPMESHCTGCGHVLSTDNRFCNQCGQPVSRPSAQQQTAPLPRLRPSSTTTKGTKSIQQTQPGSDEDAALEQDTWANGQVPHDGTGVLGTAKSGEILENLRSLMPSGLASKFDAVAPHISGEQREVTVLFLDVTNFTAASHRLDSEDIYLIIDEAMRLLVEIIYKYEGTVDKFTGDGLIALFGAPIAHENDPERALRASLEMLQVLQPLRQRTLAQHSFDFQVRIGVNTGLVIAGSLGNNLHMEYTVIGDTVNMASRLETAAQPGSILVSFSTYQRTRPLFNFVGLPPVTMKGFPDPVRAYRPIHVREQPGSVRGLPGLRVPMIGRSEDIARLEHAMDRVQTEKRRQVSVITGDAGLGKSRLVVEFCESLGPGFRYFQGNCLAYARSRPLWVVAEMIRNMARIIEVDPVPHQIAQLQRFLAEHALDEQEILPTLLHILDLQALELAASDLPASGFDSLQESVFAILRKVLLACRNEPFILIFDDLHWVDPASRQFLQSLIRHTETEPLHLILVSRDFERLTVMRPILDVCASMPDVFHDIRLRALSVGESRLLVNQLVRQSEAKIEELNEVIVARAEGNPFYTEEIVRMLMDKGGIIDQGDEWVTTTRAKDLLRSVPGTLRGLILARFDQLSLDLRQALQHAAVLGRIFPARLLEKLYAGDTGGLLEHLQELTDRQFLQEESNSSEREFSFRHTLIQEAVYTTLLKRERRRLHGMVADVIKDSSFWLPEEQAEALAYHYAESSDPDKAIPYLISQTDSVARRTLVETANRRLPSYHQPSPI